MRYKNLLCLLFVVILASCLITITQSTAAAVPTPVEVWAWPLDGDFIVLTNSKHGTTLENTDFAVKNLDLVHPLPDHITCFDVGWHRLYHAGVDLYLRDGNTAGVPVRAAASGIVEYIDGGTDNVAAVIYHPDENVWSAYWHMSNPQISQGDTVETGQIIGYVFQQPYTGRFPDVHPYGSDDSHLHFEIRTFYDGGNLFPNFPDCNTNYIPGVGYTYPDLPDSYGYLNPIQFIQDRLIPPFISHFVYLPVVRADESCIEGQNLVLYNPGFEFPVDDPRPWFEITTFFDVPNIHYYHIVENDAYQAWEGQHSTLFGNQVIWGRIVDEEMVQSVRIPGGTSWVEWRQFIKIRGQGPLGHGTDFGDKFIFTLKDAQTGLSLIDDVVVDHTSTNYPNEVWLEWRLNIGNISALDRRNISPSISSLTDGDTTASTLRVDWVQLITHCSGTPPANGVTIHLAAEQ
ncbi:MAG: M23 family metallopeptidase [Anaerolineae bacterium]|nr:M23 family metallopeptidase [Anaerolineae bacterium]